MPFDRVRQLSKTFLSRVLKLQSHRWLQGSRGAVGGWVQRGLLARDSCEVSGN
jgi:hypothetical protein